MHKPMQGFEAKHCYESINIEELYQIHTSAHTQRTWSAALQTSFHKAMMTMGKRALYDRTAKVSTGVPPMLLQACMLTGSRVVLLGSGPHRHQYQRPMCILLRRVQAHGGPPEEQEGRSPHVSPSPEACGREGIVRGRVSDSSLYSRVDAAPAPSIDRPQLSTRRWRAGGLT